MQGAGIVGRGWGGEGRVWGGEVGGRRDRAGRRPSCMCDLFLGAAAVDIPRASCTQLCLPPFPPPPAPLQGLLLFASSLASSTQ